MEQKYQKEIDLGKMFKTLAKRWVAIVLAFVIALVAGAAVTFLATFSNKVYGVDLDFYFYQIPNVDKDGNSIIGTPIEYDDSTMNMIYQNISSQSFIEAIFCENGIPKSEGETDQDMLNAINLANEKTAELDTARKNLAKTALELTVAKKATVTAKSSFDTEKADYDAARSEYNNALQANATASTPIVSDEVMKALSDSLNEQKTKYNQAKVAYDNSVKETQRVESAYEVCKQEIINLNKEVRDAKSSAMALKRKQAAFNEEVKDAAKSITVSYADKNGEIKSTIRVSIAVDKKIANSEEFAKKLAERVKQELPNFIVEKVDYATANCELTNVLDEVEQVNKKDLIMTPVKIGLIAGVVALVVACVVVAVKNKQEFVVLVPYDTEE
ncbi:MAG: hypothetical protein E7346_00530 [Clostridiales bacterium]|nr:hypothetical protein [Clostridiales bacterium]